MSGARQVGVVGATGIGVGSMLGAGVFVAWAPAAAAAGSLLALSLAIAAVVALINALSTAQLAATYPVAGGAFAYGRRELGPAWGFAAGIGFVVGKTASVAAVALAIGRYAYPDHAAWVATAAIVVSWALNSRGITRTAGGATVIAVAVIVALLGIVAAAWWRGPLPTATYEFTSAGGGGLGVVTGAAVLFFAFAGYARVATLGEEVRRPARAIPRAIIAAFVVVLALYALIAVSLQQLVGLRIVAAVEAPVAELARASAVSGSVVAGVAALAAAGALLALTAGVGRTAMAMARDGELPGALARLNGVGVPALAEAVSAAVAIALVWLGGLEFALSMSACAVLVYYAVANAAAYRQRRAGRATAVRLPAWVSAAGYLACLALALTLPWPVLAATGAAFALAFAVRVGARALRSREDEAAPRRSLR